jgi:hypothetical protein
MLHSCFDHLILQPIKLWLRLLLLLSLLLLLLLLGPACGLVSLPSSLQAGLVVTTAPAGMHGQAATVTTET